MNEIKFDLNQIHSLFEKVDTLCQKQKTVKEIAAELHTNSKIVEFYLQNHPIKNRIRKSTKIIFEENKKILKETLERLDNILKK